MKLKIDEKNDTMYLRIDESAIVESEEVSPGVILDFNDKNQVVGVEFLKVSTRGNNINLKSLQLETA
jgi:uncharacterized protein YuzE